MIMSHMICFLSHLAVLISILQTAECIQKFMDVEFRVINRAVNTPGGNRFENLNLITFCEDAMVQATKFTWNTFNYTPSKKIRKRKKITTTFSDRIVVSSGQKDEISIPASFFNLYPDDDDLKKIIKGEIYELIVLSWQALSGPEDLVLGIGSFVRIKAGLVPDFYQKKGDGETWDESSSVTGWFLDYCQDTIIGGDGGFVAKLNRNLAEKKYTDSDMLELFGNKTIQQKWKEYEDACAKTMYANHEAPTP